MHTASAIRRMAFILLLLALPAILIAPALLVTASSPGNSATHSPQFNLSDGTGGPPTLTPGSALMLPTDTPTPADMATQIVPSPIGLPWPTHTPYPTVTPYATLDTTASLDFDHVSSHVQAGDSFTVDLLVTTEKTSRGGQTGLTFDPAVLSCDGVVEGSFYKSWATSLGGGTVMLPSTPAIDNNAGTVGLTGVAILGASNPVNGHAGGPNGTGIFLTFKFTAKANGYSLLKLVSARLIDDSYPLVFPLPLQVRNGAVFVGVIPTPTAPPLTDLHGVIKGVVYFDENGNGVHDTGEPGLLGVPVRLFTDGVLLGTVTTRAGGAYRFPHLPPGAYMVQEMHPAWMRFSSSPDAVPVTVTGGEDAVVAFGDWNGFPSWLPLLMR